MNKTVAMGGITFGGEVVLGEEPPEFSTGVRQLPWGLSFFVQGPPVPAFGVQGSTSVISPSSPVEGEGTEPCLVVEEDALPSVSSSEVVVTSPRGGGPLDLV